MTSSIPPLTLDCTSLRECFIVTAVQPPARAPEWGPWLEEIGFMPGERVELMARGAFRTTAMSGPEFVEWLDRTESFHKTLMREARLLAK